MAPKDFEPLIGSGISLDTTTLSFTRTGTGLDYLVDEALKDPGLNQWASDADIKAGANAAAGMNVIIVKAIKATGVANDGVFTATDVHLMSDWIYKNHFTEFKKLHGDDENNLETGFHLIQGDGGSLQIFGDKLVNQVADSIYHIGFKTSGNRLQNEDGDANARTEKVAYWLNELMADDLSSGSLANNSVTPMVQGTTGTGLDQLVETITTDPGLARHISAQDINDGARAANDMNKIVIDGIKALGIANNGSFSASDIRDLSDWIKSNHKTAWTVAHGDDEDNTETGFHLVQNDGANTRSFSYNEVNTVADGIYHLGFGHKNGAVINEDGNGNASLTNVAHWLNTLLESDLEGGQLKNASVDPYPNGTTGTALDAVVDGLVDDAGLARNFSTNELAKIAKDVDGLNTLLLDGIKSTGIANDGHFTALDIEVLGQWIKNNAAPEWTALRGDDDANTGLMGLVWDGAVNQLAGVNAVNAFGATVYSLGFTQKWGGIIDEDGDWRGTAEKAALWLNDILSVELSDGTLGNASQSATDPSTFADAIVAQNGAVNVTDDDNTAQISQTNALKLSEGTVAFTFVAEDMSSKSGQVLFAKDATSKKNGDLQVYFYDDKLYAKVTSGGTENYINIPAQLNEGEAHDFALSFGASGISVWIDGVLAEYRSDLPMNWKNNIEDIYIGAKSNGKTGADADVQNEFQGEILGFTVYDRILDRGEIEGLSFGVNSTGNASNNNIAGSTGNDALQGGLGRDVIDAGAGDDAAYGGYGADLIRGGDGNDIMDGGHGQDELMGGDGDDILVSTSDGREQTPGQLLPGYAKKARPDNGDLDPATNKLYPDQPLASDDTLTGGDGADTFRFQFMINAKYDIIMKHARADGSINWRGVAGENTYVHDHWVDMIGDDIITDFNRAEGDTIEIAGHTLNIENITYHDSNNDGVNDYTKISFISRQGNGGAHDEDNLGSLTVYGDLVDLGDITQIPSNTVFYGIVENIADIDEAITPLEVDNGTPRNIAEQNISDGSGPRGSADTSGSANTAAGTIAPAARSGTGLDTILDWIETDQGLQNQITDAEIEEGAAAASAMNDIVIEAIKATGAGNDGLIDGSDVYEIADWIKANRKADWNKYHGDDENNVETAFHLVQGDGAVEKAYGRGAVNTVADAIYHLGFGYKKDRLINEDGNANERVESVAYWLNSLLSDDLASGALSNGGPAVEVTGSTGTGLDQLVDIIMADDGLNRNLPNSEQNSGAQAADTMNGIIIQSIKATGIGNNGEISIGDVMVLADYIKANHSGAWTTAHGDDEKNIETGFHKVQSDGGQERLFGSAAVDTVADGIYHLGFGYKNGALINEDGNANASLSDVAGWLTGLLEADLQNGSLSNSNKNLYITGTTGTGLDILVDMITQDVGLSNALKTDQIAKGAAAADAMNALLVEGIKATGIANDGQISTLDIIDLDDWMRSNNDAEHRQLNGKNGFDPIENWNATSPIFGANGINEVADAIYSIGFGTKWGNSLFDENGNWTETLDNTAAWLSGILAQDLASGALHSAGMAYTAPSAFADDMIVAPADVIADGVTGSMDVNHTSAMSLKEGTVAFSFQVSNLPSSGSNMALFSKDARDYGTGGHTQIYINSTELWVRMQSNTKSNYYKAQLNEPLEEGVQYDLALVFGSGGLKLFVDGEKVITEPSMTLNWLKNGEDIVFGGSGDWRNSKYPDSVHSVLDGKITNAAIYDRALDQGEVAGLHGVNSDITGGSITPIDPGPVDPGPVDPTPIDPTPEDPAPTDPVDPPSNDGKTIQGDDTDNKLTGTDGDDVINGGDGNDKINGGAGDDTISAGSGKDGFVKGGSGADTFKFGIGDGEIKIFDWEDGIDKIELTGGLDYSDLTQSTSVHKGITTVIYTTYAGDKLKFRDENASDLDGTDFNEGSGSISAQGFSSTSSSSSSNTSSGGSTFKPSDYDTEFTGGNGNDPHTGTSERDWIDGGDGNDKINGKAGDDYIIAGAGNDHFIRGGAGADIFQFGIGDGDVKIHDWEDGIDKIHLAGGLKLSDLAQSQSSYNGIKTAIFTTEAGDRLMLRDEVTSDITSADFA